MTTFGDRVFEQQRQTRRGGVNPNGLDATRIDKGLWMGSRPATDRTVGEAGFDLLVLCAEEYQPPAWLFPGVDVIHAPFDDDDIGPTPNEKQIAANAAKRVAHAIRQRANVLVTCNAGRNRSGLVCGLALVANSHDPVHAIHLIQSRRAHALSNQHFVDMIAGS